MAFSPREHIYRLFTLISERHQLGYIKIVIIFDLQHYLLRLGARHIATLHQVGPVFQSYWNNQQARHKVIERFAHTNPLGSRILADCD
jgi:hypothetical protein